ncbi:hypothetical protein ZWY2020_054138 [Hordeum vulgare]|nr:hypothetical protein ZWY2020_054138 [Hordeum vulgare]
MAPPDYGYGYPDSDSDGEDEESVEEMAPPAYGYPDGGELPPFVLIDPRAYFVDRDNATTAVCEMEGPSLKGRLKVTFCAVAPPLVSYFCVHTSHMDHTEFPVTPHILATETDGGLVLLCLATGNHHTDHCLQKQNNDAIVYFLAKNSFSPMERTASVLAVDMENETAEQVVEFPAKRTYCLAKGYDASRISAYLQPAPGTQQTSKRPGVPLLKCPSKKHIKDVEDPEEDDAMVISYS